MRVRELSRINEIEEGRGFSKRLIFYFFNRLQHGKLIISEQDKVIGVFGDMKSTMVAHIQVENPKFYSRVLLGGSIGAGESYVDGDWNTPNLKYVVQVFLKNYEILDEIEKKYTWLTRLSNSWTHLSRKNSILQAKKNISFHYDLGNDLYKTFLDPTMMYSSAVFSNEHQSLEEAQKNKLKIICEKLQLKSSDHILEIGTGWGGLAIYMAENYGCRVTTTTISEQQHQYAKAKIEEAKLQDKIQLLKKDYRDLTGKYDKIVSIEMIEAVGKDYLSGFLVRCNNLLKSEGLMLIQSINILDQRMQSYARGVDFIQKHIFPGGFLPSLTEMAKILTEKTDLTIRDIHDIGLDYAKTLDCWFQSFSENFQQIKGQKYDERFYRLWEFYLKSCEAGFLQRNCSATQMILSHKDYFGTIKRG
ncbi:MAG: class I SAM-dependent methyltransferase [Bdellovibrionales bacterium]|nr:class I SAM-dependent methyltransferase [Bdellovibrionales bacterium]